MPERIGGLSQEEIKNAFDIFFNVRDQRELRHAIDKNPVLKAPVFHAMLRQEFMNLYQRKDIPSEIKESLLAKYDDFFAILHYICYTEHIRAIHIEKKEVLPDKYACDRFLQKISLASSISEAIQLSICWLNENGKLENLSALSPSFSVPILISQTTMVDFWDTLRKIIIVDNKAPKLLDNISPSFASNSHDSLMCISALEWTCLSCHNTFSDIHLNFINLIKNPHFSKLISKKELNFHPCPYCLSDQTAPSKILSTEVSGIVDPLMASSSLILPERSFRVFCPPPLTSRNQSIDRILEIRLSKLEQLLEEQIHDLSRNGLRTLSYNIVYDTNELNARVSEFLQFESDPAAELSKKKAFTENLIHEITRKIKAGEMTLDMALETTRKIAKENADAFDPTLLLYSDVSNIDTEAYQIAAAVQGIILEAQGYNDHIQKVMIGLNTVSAHLRVGDLGLALAEMEKVKKSWETVKFQNEDRPIIGVEAHKLSVESDLLRAQRKQKESDEKLVESISKWDNAIENLEKTSGICIEFQHNRLAGLNLLALRHKDTGKLTISFELFNQVKRECQELIENIKASQELDAATASEMEKSTQYLIGGVISNQGNIFRELRRIGERLIEVQKSLKEPSNIHSIQELKDHYHSSHDKQARFFVEYLDFIVSIFPKAQIQDILDNVVLNELKKQSIGCFRGALEISESINGHHYGSVQARNLGIELIDINYEEGLSLLRKSVDFARIAPGQDNTLIDSLLVLASALTRTEQFEEIANLLEEAIKLKLQERVKVGTSSLRQVYGSELEGYASYLADARYKLGQKRETIEALESVKSNLLSTELERVLPRIDEIADNDPDIYKLNQLEAKREQLTNSLDILLERYSILPRPSLDEKKTLENLASQINQLNNEIKDLSETLLLRHPRFEQWVRHSTITPFEYDTFSDIFSRYENVIPVLGFFIANDITWIYLITENNIDIKMQKIEQGGILKLSEEIFSLLDSMTLSFQPIHQKILENLSNILLDPFKEKLLTFPSGTDLMICPHFTLFLLPWSLLPINGRVLGELFCLHQIYGLGVLETMLTRDSKKESKDILVISDPLKGTEMSLPNARVESQALSEMANKLNIPVTLLEGNNANIANLIRFAPNSQIIHFACHGSFGGITDESSQLYLAPSHDEEKFDSGHLTVAKIVESLDLQSCDLVNLSACDTGLLNYEGGGEMNGLTRAFIASGANNVLASLWPLNDYCANIFSQVFYENYLITGNAGRALQETQAKCMSGYLGDEMKNPRHWAGYILVGIPKVAKAGYR